MKEEFNLRIVQNLNLQKQKKKSYNFLHHTLLHINIMETIFFEIIYFVVARNEKGKKNSFI